MYSILKRFVHAEQIGSGRWFNDCVWHHATLLFHWISNIQLCVFPLYSHSHSWAHIHKNSFLFCYFPYACWNKEQIMTIIIVMTENECALVSAVWLYCGFSISTKAYSFTIAYRFVCTIHVPSIYIIYLDTFRTVWCSPFVKLTL